MPFASPSPPYVRVLYHAREGGAMMCDTALPWCARRGADDTQDEPFMTRIMGRCCCASARGAVAHHGGVLLRFMILPPPQSLVGHVLLGRNKPEGKAAGASSLSFGREERCGSRQLAGCCDVRDYCRSGRMERNTGGKGRTASPSARAAYFGMKERQGATFLGRTINWWRAV